MPKEPEKEIHLTIPMLQNMELAATKTAEAVAEVMHLDEEKITEVSMAIIEACLNSFEHSRSEDKNVYITFTVKEEQLLIVLRDYGGGFDPSKLEEPKMEEKLKTGVRKRGWGLKLMESMMDSVEIESSSQGTTITMTKKK